MRPSKRDIVIATRKSTLATVQSEAIGQRILSFNPRVQLQMVPLESEGDQVKDVRVLIRKLNTVLRGWGNYFRTGNAAIKFQQVDDYVYRRLERCMVKRKGRNLHAGQADRWTRDFFFGLGLYRLRGTVRYPTPRNAAARETTGKPCAGKPHARFERGSCRSFNMRKRK